MIAVINSQATSQQLENLVCWLEGKGLDVNVSNGSEATIVGLIGDTSRVDVSLLESMSIIDSVTRVSEPFKAANRKFHPADSRIEICEGVAIGTGEFQVIAGPASIEGEGFFEIAKAVKAAGATILQGGAFIPRTDPYAGCGLGERGLELLREARCELGIPVLTEINDVRQVGLFSNYEIDVWRVGSRNMQNYDLLKEVGMSGKPVLLERGVASTIDELLMSAEYIMSEGNPNVILCERGIRSFESRTKGTLDLSAVPVLHHLSHLPVVVEPSVACGYGRYVPALAMSAVAGGADGIALEVHADPQSAMADGQQAILPDQLAKLAPKFKEVREIIR